MSSVLLLRLAVLLAAFLVQASEGVTYEDFANRHIENPKTKTPNSAVYCNLLMQKRGMTRGFCKPVNTFINNKPSQIERICCRGGTRVSDTNLYDSKRHFRTVTCRNRGRYPNCNYVGKKEVRRIRVACVSSLPVHFEKLL